MFRRQDAARGGCLRLCKEMGNISIRKTMTIVGNKEMYYSGYAFCPHTHSAFSQRNHCSRCVSCQHDSSFPPCVQPNSTINYSQRIFGQHPHSLRCVLCKQNDRSRCVFRWLARPHRRADPTHRTAQQSCSKKTEEQALRTEARSGAAQATRADVEGETTHQNVSTTRRCTRRLS